jgi:hypothetical protein
MVRYERATGLTNVVEPRRKRLEVVGSIYRGAVEQSLRDEERALLRRRFD